MAIAAGTSFLAPARAQSVNFGPVSSDLGVPVFTGWDQVWCDASRGPAGTVFTWSSNQDVFLRFYDLAFAPRTGDLFANSTLNLDVQDEPAVAWSQANNVLVAWSERHGYDGEQMGIFARRYDMNGVPSGAEFQVNVSGAASQWRPLVAPRVGGGWLVAWSGDWDGDSFFRIFDEAGAPLSGDVRINVFEFDAQVDPAIAQASDGTIFTAFVDFASHDNIGAGLNLWGRTFSANGTPLQAFEFPLLPFANGDQREPRVAVDGLDRFVLVYQDDAGDGSGNAILCRRFTSAGVPLALPFRVNTTTASDQVEARVVAFEDGGFVVTWMDFSQGQPRVRGQRFDTNAAPLGDEFGVNENVGSCWHHNLAANARGTELIAAYDSIEASSGLSDVYRRRFKTSATPVAYGEAKVNSQGCLPSISGAGTPTPSGTAPFTITATNVLNNKYGFVVYGHESSFTPYRGGTWLVGQPFRRGGNFDTGGNPPPNDCSGVIQYDFNARIRSGVDPELVPGRTISVQFIYRDVPDPTGYGLGLTDALRFTIAP